MEKNTKVKVAFWLNISIVVLEVLSVLMMMTGFTFQEGAGTLSATRLKSLRYYTVDSNIFMGIVSAFMAVSQYKVMKGKKEDVSRILYVFALLGTVGVTLTMIITIFYLAPLYAPTSGWFSCFKNSNFFLHLLNPVLSIVVFTAFEKTKKISFVHTFTGIVTMLIYSTYYSIQAFLTMENGVIVKSHDWYGFFFLGVKSLFVVIPIFIVLTYAISFGLWTLNKKGIK